MNTYIQTHELDGNSEAAYFDFDVLDYTSGTIQCEITTGSWGSAVVTVYRSNDGARWQTLATGVTFSGAGFSSSIDVTGTGMLRVQVTTVAGTSLVLAVTPCFKDSP